ncbi:unnamed protein product [Gemmataceae bacterium]|nr:unnamed protein product [Gemmataceae bacterium]VTU02443.1 unnamed protein product [Gemmataceae bacterium]
MTAFTCPTCRDARGLPVRLDVVQVSHPGPGLTVRRRRCPACRRVTHTEERPRPVAAGARPPALRT